MTVAGAADAEEPMPIEIVWREEVRVRVGPGFDSRTLHDLLGVLKPEPC